MKIRINEKGNLFYMPETVTSDLELDILDGICDIDFKMNRIYAASEEKEKYRKIGFYTYRDFGWLGMDWYDCAGNHRIGDRQHYKTFYSRYDWYDDYFECNEMEKIIKDTFYPEAYDFLYSMKLKEFEIMKRFGELKPDVEYWINIDNHRYKIIIQESVIEHDEYFYPFYFKERYFRNNYNGYDDDFSTLNEDDDDYWLGRYHMG